MRSAGSGQNHYQAYEYYVYHAGQKSNFELEIQEGSENRG